MKEVGELSVCGLVYRVAVASVDETSDLSADDDGACVYSSGRIFIRASLSPSRKRDALVHEIAHAFIEASGLQAFLKSWVGEEKYDAFEESFIRLLTPAFLRFVDDNARELVRLVKKGKWSSEEGYPLRRRRRAG
jgi:hypothetical protein